VLLYAEKCQTTDRLYEAVKTGWLPDDATLANRADEPQARLQEILTVMVGIRREAELPEKVLSVKNVRMYCAALRKKLHDPASWELPF